MPKLWIEAYSRNAAHASKIYVSYLLQSHLPLLLFGSVMFYELIEGGLRFKKFASISCLRASLPHANSFSRSMDP